jgi:integrase
MRKKLNDLVLRHLTPPDDKPFAYVWDEHLPAFGVRVGKNRKTFVAKRGNDYLTLGHVGVITLADARQKAKTLLYAKYLPKVSPNAQTLVEEYQKAIASQLRPKSVTVYGTYLRLIPSRPLTEITVQDWYAALPEKKTAANMCFKVFKTFCSWCVERGHLDFNPLTKRKQPNKTKSRDRLLTDEEVKAIWTESYNHSRFGVLLRLLFLTGQRLNQIVSFQGSWLNNTDKYVIFPAYVMKNNTEHTLPITSLVQNELNSLNSQNTYIWGDKPFTHPQNHMKLFRKALQCPTRDSNPQTLKGNTALEAGVYTIPPIGPPHFTLHDFRRYVSSTMAKLKVPQEVTERILAHRDGVVSGVAAVYNRHSYQDEMREALERYQQHLVDIGCKSP